MRGPDAAYPRELFPQVLVRQVRIVTVGGVAAPDGTVDLRMREGRIVEVGPSLTAIPQDEEVLDAAGRWAAPGLWDHHVHLAQWADTLTRLDLAGTIGPDEVLTRVAARVVTLDGSGDRESVVVGFGYRSATWPRQARVDELDAVSGRHPVVLVSGDAHNGWVNSAGLRLLGAPPTEVPLTENDWFPLMGRLDELTGSRESKDAAYREAVAQAAARGIVGIGDMEFGDGVGAWPPRFAAGVRDLRARVAVYPDGLDAVIAAGLRSGDDLCESGGLVRMGPLKVISDGSLNTRTAYCDHPYAAVPGSGGAGGPGGTSGPGGKGGTGGPVADPCGRSNYTAAKLTGLAERATRAGLRLAIHAIGDAAVAQALDVFEATGGRGTIEHVQLMRWSDLPRMARLRVGASVQPAHLLDDRDVTALCWPDRADRCFVLRSMHEAGIALLLGSDAPVAPMDPWLAMAAAVHRSADERPPWNCAEALTPAQALAGSTDRQGTLRAGSRADVVLLDADPLAPPRGEADGGTAATAERLRSMPVAATFLGGRLTHRGGW